MKQNSESVLAESKETGSTGIYHLKRLWSKAIAGATLTGEQDNEAELDATLVDILGLGLLPTYQFLYEQRPGFEAFEQWVIAQAGGHITAETIQQCNNLFNNEVTSRYADTYDVLTPEDISFWNEYGYVVVKNAVSKEDCAASRNAIWNYLEMEEHDPATWYKDSSNALQGIMVPLYRNAAIDKNRNSATIRRAFEQLWNQTGLIVTLDKCGFNPPETGAFKYRGIGLHWDVSLKTPIPFGTQGILYLADTAANQGALTVIPSFHKKMESWLKSLPENTNPRQTDFSKFNPVPIAADAGDLIIWNHQLPHSSSPNRANLPRLVQYINWYDPLQKKQEVWI
jgi:hypothetical protein